MATQTNSLGHAADPMTQATVLTEEQIKREKAAINPITSAVQNIFNKISDTHDAFANSAFIALSCVGFYYKPPLFLAGICAGIFAKCYVNANQHSAGENALLNYISAIEDWKLGQDFPEVPEPEDILYSLPYAICSNLAATNTKADVNHTENVLLGKLLFPHLPSFLKKITSIGRTILGVFVHPYLEKIPLANRVLSVIVLPESVLDFQFKRLPFIYGTTCGASLVNFATSKVFWF